jgi:xylan 1,4-beta-xylosidase
MEWRFPSTLNRSTRDRPEVDRATGVGQDGSCEFSIPMRSNDVVLVKLEMINKQKPFETNR